MELIENYSFLTDFYQVCFSEKVGFNSKFRKRAEGVTKENRSDRRIILDPKTQMKLKILVLSFINIEMNRVKIQKR
jgi:hypothetical protein